jgi:hypothetical protein
MGERRALVLVALVAGCGPPGGVGLIDFASGDFGSPPDLIAPPDLSVPADMTKPPDLLVPDTTPPAGITTLTATVTGFTTIRLDWTTVGDDGNTGTATSYDVRQSSAPITTITEFEAATPITGTLPAPALAGLFQMVNVTGLAPGTTYYFAMRVSDEVPNAGALSNVPMATTTARARFLISEVGAVNTATEGFDFVELLVTQAGRTDGVVVAQAGATLYTLGMLDLAVGDRVVVHATGDPCPAGCAQEDVSGMIMGSTAAFASGTAWDVYSGTLGIVGSDNLITVGDGTTVMDAVTLSNRDNDVTLATMMAFAALGTQWPFSPAPVDGVNDCATQTQAVSVATGNTVCGGFAIAVAGSSVQRTGTSDTNTKADFYWAAQTPGATNAANPPPTVAAVTVPSATEVRVRFSDEIAAGSVMAGNFTISGLTVMAASLVDVHVVSLTTSAQTPAAPYTVIAAVTDLQGTAIGTPNSGAFNGFVAPDVTAPAAISTLAATVIGPRTVRLDWTAVGDDNLTGTATTYDVRFSTAPITSNALFMAATPAGAAPTPAASGGAETMMVTGLNPSTQYYFAIRVSDEVPNVGDVSNSPTATTMARATLLITEVAVQNGAAEGFDFVEMVAIAPGRTDGLTVQQGTSVLYTLGALNLAAGDRVVMHATGNPCPTNCSQEDTTGVITGSTATFSSATAWDVYSGTSGLTATDNTITVRDGTIIQDAVAISDRDGDATATAMTQFAALATANQWSFGGVTPTDGTNDCATQRASVSSANADSACGGFPGTVAGRSAQRVGALDTNTKADFYAAAQTPGLANGANPAPQVVSASAVSATEVRVVFNDELASASLAGNVSVAGLGVSTATLFDANIVSVTTTVSQTPGQRYTAQATAAVTDVQGTALIAPTSADFCGFSSTPVAVIINEVAPNLGASRDLVELRVTAPGPLQGMVLRQNPTSATSGGTVLATLPNICAQLNDLVVVHLTPLAGPVNELLTKNEQPVATFTQNYDNAWDVVGNATGITYTDTVLSVHRSSTGTVVDAVVFSDYNNSTIAAFDTTLVAMQTAGAWLPTLCGGTCTGTAAETVSADWRLVGINASGAMSDTVRRNAAGTDTHLLGDFSVGAQTMGNPN